MKNFQTLYDAGAVLRWHTWPTIKPQDLAAHSWGVAMIVSQITPATALPNLIQAALTHDLHEVEAGDIPYPFKKNNADVRMAYDNQEQTFGFRHELPMPLDEYEVHILKWADMFELYLFANREFQLGNQKMARTMTVAINALREMGPPNDAALALLKEYGHEH